MPGRHRRRPPTGQAASGVADALCRPGRQRGGRTGRPARFHVKRSGLLRYSKIQPSASRVHDVVACSPKKSAISRAALSGPSEPWIRFRPFIKP